MFTMITSSNLNDFSSILKMRHILLFLCAIVCAVMLPLVQPWFTDHVFHQTFVSPSDTFTIAVTDSLTRTHQEPNFYQ
jgi:hypothetical protein